jgi:signal peptidase I
MTRRSYLAAAVFVIVVLGTRFWVLTPVRVASASMEPSLRTGDTVLVDHLSARVTGWQRGDVVVFRSPQDGELTLKRIVGLPGDEVSIEDALLSVNGRRVQETYADLSHVDGLYVGPITVPPGGYYLLGDSRAGSVDSRSYGAVADRQLVGRMLLSWSL